jgi:hypothetical protein
MLKLAKTLGIWIGGLALAVFAFLTALAIGFETGLIERPALPPKAEARPSDLNPWPFTADKAVLRCRDGVSRTAEIEGREYRLNGLAARRYPDLEPVWLPNPEIPGSRISISEASAKAAELCDDPNGKLVVRR